MRASNTRCVQTILQLGIITGQSWKRRSRRQKSTMSGALRAVNSKTFRRTRLNHSIDKVFMSHLHTCTSHKYVKTLRSILCIPDGGDVGYKMTELQPSPSGYRVQDEAPSPPSCPPGSYKSYASHGHGSETANFKTAASYSQEGYGLKQSPPRPVALNEYYRRRNDGRRSSMEGNDHEGGKKAATVAGYNDGHKKNTSGYKNDSGYSESLGFDSFTLPLNERDEASPPPTPPVRDASSLKGVCYGPGHEKYPSWPSAPERHPDEDIHSSGHSGSHRSKSWTDHTNYPKEKPAQYTRPHTKRPNPAFTQQLKTVMERCEKIPAETYESRNRSNVEEEAVSRLWPRVDREGKALGDAEYVVPSPPEREQQPQTLNHAELEAYVRSYQDPQVSQVDLYRETTLTQAGLEEYTRVQHSQQASYAQSEGYHSYVSSVDSTTNTPFLDRLRRDSEAVAQRPAASWEDTSREGRDSVVTTSSGSASSSETLKWHGSMSDVSVSSGMPPRQGTSDRWHHGSMSDVSSVNGGILTQKPNNHEKWQGSMSDVSTSGMGTKGRYSLDKWQTSMNDRNKQGQSRPSLPAVIGHCTTTSASINVICHQTSSVRESKWQESNIDDDSNERSQTNQWDNSSRLESDKYTSMPQSPTRQQVGNASPQGSENWNVIHGSMSDVSQTNGIQCSKQLIAHSARVQTPQRHHSESVLYLDRERNQRKLYPVSTTQPQESTQSSRMTLNSPSQPQLSVAERINELEKQQQQQMRYTYLDPEKRHRVSDPTLKAIQKKALWSFYERHQASWRSEPQLTQGPAPAPQSPQSRQSPQSPPPQPPPRPKLSSSRRASSASDYASGTWRENVNRSQNQGNGDLPTPKHQHSNSCSSLSTDLLGPVIVGPAISIDDWVPERPPKKAHLRNAYNDRMPSPDLPPPSPPTITESEVHDCDDPLPPPPPELSGDSFTEGQRKSNNSTHHQTEETAKINRERSCERHKSERHSMKRSKHNGKRDHDKSNGKSASNLTKTGVQEQDQPHQFVRSSIGLKHVDSEMVLENGVSAGFATHRMVATGRSSLRYPSTQKLMVNGRIAPTRRISEERPFSARPAAQLPDLISQRYSDSGNQRPAPQVPVEPRIIRQESMRVDGTRVDASGLLRNDADQRLESSSGQRPQPQVPKNADKNVIANPSSRPNYLSTTEKNPSKYLKSGNHSFSIGNSVKTGYEASSKLFPSESNPQKYHEPPKYVPNHQRSSDTTQRNTHNYCALPPKYIDISKQKSQPQCSTERYSTGSSNSPPPPLAPRQNTPGRKSLPPPPRPAPHQGHETIPSTPVTPLSVDLTSPLSPTSAYFTTSEGKARFLTRYSQDVTAEGLTRQEDAPVVEPTNSLDLKQKKEELMMRLDRKLVVLKAEQEAVREEGEMNEALGARVTARVSAVARPPEASKYRNHVEEVGKITSLLLGLSGRLARAENALYGMPADHAERKILESKRDKLMDQLEEAKILKNNIDKRSVNVSAILAKYLNEEEFADYQHFINMKAKLIVDGREILDKVKLGEEQLIALKEAID
ncbi:hypothetical protein ACFW04_002688 [Cataglyphis niger]